MSTIPTDPGRIHEILGRLADELVPMASTGAPLAFIGIRSGGELVAKELVAMLEERTGTRLPLGVLDITLYRDDISRRRIYPEVKATDIPFDVDGLDILLVDDVIYTGRSARAAIDHIVDLGRPRRIYLLVLFDRGGRELPIQPDFAGMRITLPEDLIIKIDSGETGRIARVVISEAK
jgi:pyrimidine operon attenuation protein/uracil phosphoribosyltransferase